MKIARASIAAACTLPLSLLFASVAYADPPSAAQVNAGATPAAPAPSPSDPSSKEAAAATPALTPVPAPTPAEIRYRRLSVDVESTRPNAVLERRVAVKEESGAFLFLPWRSTQGTWEQVCVAPCRGADLDRYSTYRVATENGISSSPAFTLPQEDGAIHLKIDAGDRLANRAGVALAGAGFAAVVVGASLLVAAPNVVNHDNETKTRTAGFVAGGVGVLALAIGIPLAILTRTCVYADDKPLRAASTKPRFIGNGFVF